MYCFDFPGTRSIERLETVLRTAMEQISAENIQTEIATIDDRDALRMTYDLPTPVGQLGGMQYHWLAGGDRACSFTLATDRPADYAELFDQIVATVQVG